MAQSVFVNLPVADLARARAFWAALGFGFDDRFSDDSAACVVVSDRIFVMLLTRARFADFAPRPLGDPGQATMAILALSRDSRAAVDAFAEAAVAAGGTENRPPMDHGPMYLRSVSDPDGHVLEAMWMDLPAFERSLGEEIDVAVDA